MGRGRRSELPQAEHQPLTEGMLAFARLLAQGRARMEPAKEQVGEIILLPQHAGQTWIRARTRAYRPKVNTGKFLFFSTDTAELIRVAVTELESGRYTSAKVSVRPSSSAEHCLCLYAPDPSDGPALARRWPGVRLWGFKSNAQTLADSRMKRTKDRSAGQPS
jgi:hypothetical protein